MGSPDSVAVLLTGVGKRYDIVSAFAQHATGVAADPNPLAPAQYAAHHRFPVPRIEDPEYVPALRSLWLDLRILARTARMVVGGDGIYKGESGGWVPPTQT